MTTNRPEFEIQVGDGRGLLLLRPRSFFGWLRVEQLELRIPEVSFPLDITRGMAQFRQQRCPVERATLATGAKELQAAVDERANRAAGAGFERIRFKLGGPAIALGARVRVGERTADLTCELRAELDGRALLVRVSEAHVLGFLRRPALVLAHDLLCVLVGAAPSASGDADTDAPIARGLGEVSLHPLELCLQRVLPPAGWRMPTTDGLVPLELELGTSGARLRYGPGEARREAAEGGAAARVGRAADEALERNDLGGAVAALRGELARGPAEARAVTTRLLSVLVSRDGSLSDARDLAEQSLERWPDFAAAELTLASIAVARGRAPEAVDHFARAAERAASSSPELAVRAWQAAADLAGDDPERAAGFHERVLALRPDELESNQAVGALYAAAGRWRELARLERARVVAERDPMARAEAHLRLAQLHAVKLEDPAAARGELDEAVRLDESSWRAWELLGRVRAAGGDRAGAIAALERAAPLMSQAGERFAEARTHVQLAAWHEEAGDAQRARGEYQRALELEPEEPTVLEQVALGAARQRDVDGAIATYQRLVAVCPADPWRRQRAERELLKLLVDAGDTDRARRLLEESAAADAESLVGLAALERAAGNPERALGALDRAVKIAAANVGEGANPRAAAIELERARLLGELSRQPEQRAALERAYRFAGESPVGEQAVRESLALEHGDAAEEAKWIDALLARRTADWGDWAFRRARLWLDAGDAAAACLILDEMRAEGKETRAAKLLHAQVLGALDDPAGHAKVLEELAAETGDVAEKVAWLVEAVKSRLRAGELPEALDAARRAEALAPADVGVRAALGEIAWQERSWDDVATVYHELVPRAEGAERVEWARRLGAALERHGRLDEAQAAYRIAVEPGAGGGETLAASHRALGELCERLGDYRGAAEAFHAAAADERTGDAPAARAELVRRAAELLWRRAPASSGRAQAIAWLEEGLRRDATHAPSLDALESIYAELGDQAAVARTVARKLEVTRAAHQRALEHDPQLRPALKFLAEDALAAGDRAAAERWYTRLAAVEAPGDDAAAERRDALTTLAQLARDDGRPADAENHLWSAVALAEPARQHDLLARIEELYELTERWADLTVLLTHHATTVADDQLRRGVELRGIRILLDRVSDGRAALEACRAARGRAGVDVELADAWVRAARHAGDARELEAALMARAALDSEPAARAARWIEAAELRRTWDDAAGADALEEQVVALALEPADLAALAERSGSARLLFHALAARVAELESADSPLDGAGARLFDALQAAAELQRAHALLADGLELAAGVAPDRRTAASWLREAAEIRRARLGDRGRAAAALERALQLTPDDGAIVDELESLCDELDAPERLATALELHLGALDGARRAPVAARLGDVWEARGDAARAERYRSEARAFEPEPELQQAQAVKLGALVRAVAPPTTSPSPLPPAQAAAAAAQAAAQAAAAPATSSPESLSSLASSFQAPATALSSLPSAPAKRAQPAPAPQPAPPVPPELADALAEARARLEQLEADDLERIGAARLSLGLLLRRAGDLSAARDQYELVLGEQPAHLRALEALIEADLQEERWGDAADALERRARAADDPVERAAFLSRAGELYFARLGDQERASNAWLRAIDLDPRHPPTLRRLIDYYWAAGDRASVLELGLALSGESGYDVVAIGAATAARVAIAAALDGDAGLTARWARALGDAGADALAGALADAAQKGTAADDLLTAARLVCAPGGPSRAVLKQALARTGDALAGALAARLS